MAGLERLGAGGGDRPLTSEENPPTIVRQLATAKAIVSGIFAA